MLKRNRLILFLSLNFCLIVQIQAQFRFDFWTTDNGLPQNSVYSMVQTADGYVWFTTLDGLVRFDGIKFKVFNRANSPGLTTNRLIYLLADNDNTIWVGTEDGGLLRFQDGKFRAFTTADGLPADKIPKIFKDSNGNLLAASQTGLARFDGAKFVAENRLDARDYALYFAPSGAFWELTENRLTATRNGKTVEYELPFQTNQISDDRTFNYPNYVQMFEDRRNSEVLWLTAAAKLYRLENGRWTVISSADGMPKSLVRSIVQDDGGGLWLGTDNDGLCRFAENRVKCYTTADGLSSDHIYNLFIDREKSLWAATGERGINRVTKQAITTFSEKNGLIDSNVYPLLQDRENNYWIGAFSALSLYKNGAVTNYTPRDGLLYEIVQSLYEDRAGRIWIGSIGGVEYLENGKFVDFTGKLGLPIGDYDFWEIYQTPDGALWFATDKGLLKYDDGGNVTKYTVENGLPSNDVKKILRAADDTLWIGTLGGLARFDGKKFESFDEKSGLPANHVRTLYQDADGLLWIGTYDGGLALWRSGRFTKITMENGLASNGVFAILPDKSGNFWMSSNQGIYRANRQQLIDFADGKISSVVSTAFGKSDGMLNAECNGGRQPAGIAASDGRLWFATQDGAAIVDPAAIPSNFLPPPVVIEAIKIGNQPLENFSNRIELQPGQENLEIVYTGLSFIKPEQVRFRYRLENLDKDWTDAGERRSVYFPYLPPGEYTFRVVAANGDNVWNETGATISISVKPHFYQTKIFYAAGALAIALAGFGLFRRRIAQLEKARHTQEDFSRRLINAHEAERRRVAAELHDSIGQTLAMIKNRAAFGSQSENEQEAKEQLKAITSQTTQAIGEVREISYNLRPYLLESLGLTKAIQSLVKKVEEVHLLDINGRIDDVDGLFSKEAEMSVYRIIQESLNNVAKHSEADEAALTIERNGAAVTITIADNGRGFDKNAPPKTDAGKGGFGLLGITERVRMLGGTLDIQTAVGTGTKLTVKIADIEKS